MKVEIITRHAITNYGSLLQAYATQSVVEELGYECEIIDYVRDDESYRNHEKTLLKRKPSWNNNVFKRFLYLALRQPESIISGRMFEKERAKYLNLSKKYHSEDELKKDVPRADVYMTGSDQVWGPTEDGSYDASYCLSFANDSKKIAYAASFGHTDMTDELKSYFIKHLASYSHIAVREDSAANIIQNFGFDVKQVLDPTLLYGSDFWGSKAEAPRNINYILIYQLHNNPKLNQYAERVAKKKGLPLIRISASLHQITRAGKMIWNPNIAQFLGYIQNANLLITDSFHGTAFAINFNTPFIEVLPNNNTGTRNVSILTLTGLSDRILVDEDSGLEDENIDFTYANEVLAKKRLESRKVLEDMITG